MSVYQSLNDPAVARALGEGKIAIIPTDTLYGVVCSAKNPEAVARLYALKKREQNPGTTIAANIEQLIGLGVKARYLKAVEHYWPNPISIEIPHMITYLHHGTGRSAFRIVRDPKVTAFLKVVGPLLTSSANQPGKKPASTIAEAQKYFGDYVDVYVDGGNLGDRAPSTIIRIIDDAVEVVRPGAVTIGPDGNITSSE